MSIWQQLLCVNLSVRISARFVKVYNLSFQPQFSRVRKLCNIFSAMMVFDFLQLLNQLLLLLEDVLQFSKGGLHLLQRELVLTLSRFVLGDPAVELSDGVVQQDPLLHQDLQLLNPGVGHGLDLAIPLLETSDLSISLGVSGHLLGSRLSGEQNLQEVSTVLVE